MRGATALTLQCLQILGLPRKMTVMIDRTHIWNVIYNARSNKQHPPTSPNTAPATQNTLQNRKGILHCGADSNIAWSEHDPTMNSSSRTGPFSEATFRALEMHFVLKITTFRAPATYPNFTKCCACHEKWHSNITKCCACHKKWHSKITKCCACHEKWHCNITKYCACHEKWHCNITKCCACYEERHSNITTKVTFQLHQILHLPQKLTLCYLIEPLLGWAVTLLSCYFTDLLLYWTATLLSCYSTEFFACLNLRNSEVSHLNFLWLKPPNWWMSSGNESSWLT